jgi:hypothetical protein
MQFTLLSISPIGYLIITIPVVNYKSPMNSLKTINNNHNNKRMLINNNSIELKNI